MVPGLPRLGSRRHPDRGRGCGAHRPRRADPRGGDRVPGLSRGAVDPAGNDMGGQRHGPGRAGAARRLLRPTHLLGHRAAAQPPHGPRRRPHLRDPAAARPSVGHADPAGLPRRHGRPGRTRLGRRHLPRAARRGAARRALAHHGVRADRAGGRPREPRDRARSRLALVARLPPGGPARVLLAAAHRRRHAPGAGGEGRAGGHPGLRAEYRTLPRPGRPAQVPARCPLDRQPHQQPAVRGARGLQLGAGARAAPVDPHRPSRTSRPASTPRCPPRT